MDSMVVRASSEISAVSANACCASVLTALATAELASGLRGLKFFSNNEEQSSLSSTAPATCATSASLSALCVISYQVASASSAGFGAAARLAMSSGSASKF